MARFLTLTLLLSVVVETTAEDKSPPAHPPAKLPSSDLPAGNKQHGAKIVNQYFKSYWLEHWIKPAARIDDATFLRRASLALNGRPPTPSAIRDFLSDRSSDKRALKVEELLARSVYADYWAFRMRDWLVGLREVVGQGTNFVTMYQASREAMAENRPWDQIAREVVSTQGNIALDGRANLGVYFDGEANEFADAAARMFLGQNIACAQCHDDPNEPTRTQRGYWGLAAFFARTEMWDINVVGKAKYDERFPEIGRSETSVSTLPGGDAAIDGSTGENRAIADVEKGEAKLPSPTDPTVMQPTPLFGKPIQHPDNAKVSRRELFAQWLTSRDNPMFARAAVNRFWIELTGRGFVDRFDGFSPSTSPRHEKLLDELSTQFVRRDYDVKWLIRTIVLSDVFQLQIANSKRAEVTWHHAKQRKLNPDQWFAAVLQATGEDRRILAIGNDLAAVLDEERNARIADRAKLLVDGAAKIRKGKFAYLADRLPKIDKSQKPIPIQINEKQRRRLTELRKQYADLGGWLKGMRGLLRQPMSPTSESLLKMNGEFVNTCLERGLTASETAKVSNASQRLEDIFLYVLNRLPTQKEHQQFASAVANSNERRIRNLLWALIQSTEFQVY